MENETILKRYTDLPALLYILKNKWLTMLDPKTWEDKNDVHYMEQYKNAKSFEMLLALCFTKAPETYHHWKVFAGGTSGACIIFRRKELLECLDKKSGITHKRVQYLTLNEMIKSFSSVSLVDELPFVKRFGFQDEREYRVVYANEKKLPTTRNIPIPISCIERISLSPWIVKSLGNTLKETIRAIDGCKDIKLTKSTLINNSMWQGKASHATKKT